MSLAICWFALSRPECWASICPDGRRRCLSSIVSDRSLLIGDTREFGWFSSAGNGLRIDHAFATPALMVDVVAVAYSHRERQEGVSDHSPLVLWSACEGTWPGGMRAFFPRRTGDRAARWRDMSHARA